MYDRRVGLLSALILFTCQAFFLFNNDVRTDAILTACVITSVWLLYEFLQNDEWKYFIGGFVFIALGMMAKGPVALMIPAWTIGIHLLLKKDFKKLFQLKWLTGIMIVFVLLIPMCWGLYEQFGWKGIEFFFWKQSFGRITGENVWRNDAGYFYLFQNFLWAFLPWTVITMYAVGEILYAYVKRFSLPEYISIGGFLLTFIALSFSKYKLPHYIFVTFPFAAIFTAEVIETQIVRNEKLSRFFRYFQLLFILLSFLFCVVIYFYVFPVENLWLPTVSFILLAFSCYVYFFKIFDGIVIPSAIAMIAVNFMLNTHFYSELLPYQSGNVAARKILEDDIPREQVYFYERSSHALDFYLQRITPPAWDIAETLKQNEGKTIWIYSEGNILQRLKEENIKPRKITEFDNYNIQLLTRKFLNPKTRGEALQKSYLVELKQ
jgi:4-amino-4-deoxy-L-arabinose transferase-like glycosyltransferase